MFSHCLHFTLRGNGGLQRSRYLNRAPRWMVPVPLECGEGAGLEPGGRGSTRGGVQARAGKPSPRRASGRALPAAGGAAPPPPGAPGPRAPRCRKWQ